MSLSISSVVMILLKTPQTYQQAPPDSSAHDYLQVDGWRFKLPDWAITKFRSARVPLPRPNTPVTFYLDAQNTYRTAGLRLSP
jgi:hypothetical protein